MGKETLVNSPGFGVLTTANMHGYYLRVMKPIYRQLSAKKVGDREIYSNTRSESAMPRLLLSVSLSVSLIVAMLQ